ncbi:cyclin-dependent kinase inhibitor 1c [Fusarium mexicanum]|uniref:Cyclin-dependent kinase inhibitor 1c n=1 Tax=Fusarium mexicanum TaxID=751941 RepID=A0A8H5MPG2_9HYPO|nr:cyclin-dependent kinase inhibitor 1c [Fusarium mexicanum]
MRYNVLAFMALVNGLAQANRFDWQSESQADVAKHEHKNAADPVFKVEVNEGHSAGNKNQLESGKLKKQGEKAEEEVKKLEEKLQKKEDELELKAAQAGGNRHHHHRHSSSYSPDPTYGPATKTTGYHHHHSGHLQKGPYTLDGEKYDYIHKPKVHFYTSYTTHAPTLSPGCVGDKCSRKPCKECHGNWAQPGCWHCKAHGATGEEVAEQVAKTTKHAPKETKAKEEEEEVEEKKKKKDPHAKTYTHGDKTVIVPKETMAPEATRPEAPQIEQPHTEGPKVIVIEEPKKKPKGEKKSEEEKEEKEKYHKEKPKHEYPKEEPKHEYPKEEPKHKHHKEEPKKEDICDKVHHHGQPSICDKIKHQHHKVDEPKKEDICSKPKGCHPHQAPAPAPHHEVKPAPAPAPAPHHEVKPAPSPVPAPHYPEQKPEVQPVPVPAPAPQQPAPAPVPAPAQPEGAKPEEGKHGNAPSVPITVPKSGATYNRVSVGIAVFAGIASMMLL